MTVGFIDIVLFILFFQLISVTPFLLFYQGNRKTSNRILAAFLFAKALCISNFITLRLYDFFYAHCPHLFFVGSSFTILWGPLLYFYTKSMTVNQFHFRKRDTLHFVPFLIHLTSMTVLFHRFDAETKRQLLDSNFLPHEYFTWMSNYNHVTFFLYTAAALYLVLDYRRQIKENYSAIEAINLTWLMTILIAFSTKWILDVAFSLLMNTKYAIIPLTLSRVVLFTFVNVLIYQGFKYPVIFRGSEIKLHSRRKVSLSEMLREQYMEKLEKIMEKQKPYLQPDLSLVELAEMVAIPPRSLSEVINISYGQNFYDFINRYRIKESEQLLTDPMPRFKTTLEILYEVGFNSKSSFHTAFKKTTGMTPSEFKKVHAN